MTPGKTRQQAYRRRMQEEGCRQVTVWLDTNAYTALQLLVTSQQADASAVTSDALRHYHAVTSYKLGDNAQWPGLSQHSDAAPRADPATQPAV